MGLFTEGKRYAWRFELIRILLLPLAVVLLDAPPGWLPLTVAAYGVVSVVYLLFMNKNNTEQVIVNVK